MSKTLLGTVKNKTYTRGHVDKLESVLDYRLLIKNDTSLKNLDKMGIRRQKNEVVMDCVDRIIPGKS